MINKFLEVLGRNLEIVSIDLKEYVLLFAVFSVIAFMCFGIAKLASKIKSWTLSVVFMLLSSVVLGSILKVLMETFLN